MAESIAVVILACRSYDVLEVTLACHMAYRAVNVRYFILQNCRGSYDAERTLMVAKRYAALYPGVITVIETDGNVSPFYSILDLLKSNCVADADLICKVDEDTFPIDGAWLSRLVSCYRDNNSDGGLAYVSPIIPNNTWGFPETLRILDLESEYLETVAADHLVGNRSHEHGIRAIPKYEIDTGANGTIWRYPHIARWLHERTALMPDKLLSATSALEPVQLPADIRYSINCILFSKHLWMELPKGEDDEEQLHRHVNKHGLRTMCCLNTPMIHLFYSPQHEENRDLTRRVSRLYRSRLNLSHPISTYISKFDDIEARLRWLEYYISLTTPAR